MLTTNDTRARRAASRVHDGSTTKDTKGLVLVLAVLLLPGVAWAQVGALVSPGPLSRAHASLEGIANCQKCHEPGHQVAASKCLSCHKPIAERIAARKGVHRDAGDQCVGCHAEHAGLDAELRPFDPKDFDHPGETGFPLDGLHAPLARECARCHKTRSFLTLRPSCASCHADPHKGSLGPTCTTCHSTAVRFAAARGAFDHARTRFPLVGAHRKVDCARCHVNRAFTGLKFAACTDCHRSPHRAALGADCTSCHANDAWQTRKMDHARTSFPLAGRHASVPCASCHKQPAVRVALKADRCANCHADVHQGQFKQDCGACHKETGFAAAPFDHAKGTKFALTGRHASLPCGQCHKNASTLAPSRAGRTERPVLFAGLSSNCASCHPDVHTGEAGDACQACHGTTAFRPVTAYSHAATLAPFFKGAHQAAPCAACHGGQARPHVWRIAGRPTGTASAPPAAIGAWHFKSIGTACAGCHVDAHRGDLGAGCETCHRVEDAGFAASGFSHATTRFALTGRHQAVACSACHKAAEPGGSVRYRGTATSCASCHTDVHLAQLGDRCETCHATDGFKIATYTHRGAGLERFFVGAHATLTCRACHRPEEANFPGGKGTAVRYRGMGTACASCHANDDAHHGALGPSCETCHEPERWATASRAFHKSGQFPLEGRHLAVPCASCHVSGVTRGTPTQCFDCHWARRQDDRYHLRLGSQCEQCHRPTSWTAVTWNHTARTGYALNVAHAVLRCDNCHKNGTFINTRLDCFGCHEEDYRRARNPNHVEAGFPTTCEACHRQTASTWGSGAFNHQAIFPLVGVHATQPCAACHVNGVYSGTPRECVGCHQDDYQRTQSPNHAAAGFPTACEACHRATDTSWRGAAFNHAQVFPLLGVHATQPCAACHVNNVYKGTARECVGCHLDDYQRTRDPNHAAAGFPTACQACHSASASSWTASFNHNQVFALVGRHAQAPCSACHGNGRYAGTPRDCYGCHRSDYDATRDPNHAGSGFPTSCESCHRASDGSWDDGRFNHTRFPITSGPHAGRPCSACHTVPSNFALFSCTTCHGRAETDGHHQGVSGYRYDSQACYACHPNGRGD